MSKRLVNPALLGPWCLVILISLIWQISVPAFAQVQTQSALSAKNVLVLYSEDKAHPAHELTDRGIRSAFRSNNLFEVQLYNEYLDLSRFSGPGHTRAVTDYMGRKYAGLKIDAIITIYPAALDMLLGKARAGFRGVPIVACEITWIQAENLERSPSRGLTTGVVLGDNTAGIMDSAFRMRPGTKRVALVAGTSRNDVAGESIFRKGLEPYAAKIDLIDLTKLPMQETLARVGSLPPDTIVLYSAIFTDGAGRSFVPREALALISQAANAPVFGLYDSYMGYGIVGGRLVSFEQQGREAATLALRIMGGESPASIPFGGEQAYVDLYDWRQLRRWNLSVDALPKGSIVINRKFTLWDFRYYIIGAVAFFLAETALIVFLIVQRRRKKVAEEELMQKTKELDQFFNVSLDLKCIVNTDAYFLRLNPAWERTLGYTLEELMAKRFLEFVHPDDLGRTREAVSTLASQQKVASFENRYRCKDGTYRWLEWSSASDGKLIYAAARDVTERKQAGQALRESEERLRDIMFSMGDWVWEVDENGVYTYSSQKGFDLLGQPREEVIGKTPFDFMPPDEAKRVAAIFSEIAANKAPIKDLENWNIRGNGESICLLTNGVPMVDEEGNLKGYRGVDKDITERKRAEAEVARARAELLRVERSLRLSELTASLAHELNQPLAAILSNAQAALRFLKSDKPDLKEFQEIMQDIISDDQRAGNVIRSLRSMMKREEREKRPTILNDVLNDVIQIFRSEAIFRNVRIETELDGSLPPVLGDKGQLQQVVLNIIMNGAEAMSRNPPGQRKLILRTQRKHHSIWVTGRDFGPGIDKENLERVFQPFFTTKGTGLGMGLAICSSIIKDHGGRIWAENNPDGGATLFIELPVISDQ